MEVAIKEISMIQLFLVFCFTFLSILICHLFPRKWIWLGAISGFFGGFLIFFNISNISSINILKGILLGILLSCSLVVSGNRTYFYGKKTLEEMRKRNK